MSAQKVHQMGRITLFRVLVVSEIHAGALNDLTFNMNINVFECICNGIGSIIS